MINISEMAQVREIVVMEGKKVKDKGLPYSLPSIGPGANPLCPGSQPTGHPPSGRLPLLSARSVITYPATEHYRSLAGTKLYCLVTEACLGTSQWPVMLCSWKGNHRPSGK